VRDQVSHPYKSTCKIIVLLFKNIKLGTFWYELARESLQN
jgi:hypothetical protein